MSPMFLCPFSIFFKVNPTFKDRERISLLVSGKVESFLFCTSLLEKTNREKYIPIQLTLANGVQMVGKFDL